MIPLDSTLYSGLYADPDVAALFTDEAEIAAMIRFEAALARAQIKLGVIPQSTLPDQIDSARVTPADLIAGAAGSGIPVPALVAALRAQIGEAAQHLHWGATTHDVMDTGLILRLRDAVRIMERRLQTLSSRLANLADMHRKTPMAGRTWMQHATPTTFGLKCATWLDPLLRQKERLAEISTRVFAVQSGGASGTRAAAERGTETMEALAEALGLSPAAPWHVSRDRLLELAGWFATTTATLGKIGADLIILAQTEIAEVTLGSTGGSSTMPQKQNPVGPSALVALARSNASALGEMHHAALQVMERDVAHWSAEWLTLPRMACSTGAALKIAEETLAGLSPNPERMRANLEMTGGAILAEAASFALARFMPRADAQALVKAAAQQDQPLISALKAQTNAPVDWNALSDPTQQIGEASQIIDDIIRAMKKSDPSRL
jgi:3-carboxy-cis,cis-muconate cycloisomerase